MIWRSYNCPKNGKVSGSQLEAVSCLYDIYMLILSGDQKSSTEPSLVLMEPVAGAQLPTRQAGGTCKPLL
jgi:hypothetical protein